MMDSLLNQSYPNWELCIANASPEELIHRVHEEVKLFTGHAPQFDDMTMLCCEYRG